MTVTLQDAINVIQAGDLARGKALLAKVLQQDPNNEAAWIWMSGTVDDIDQRRYCLEKALEINPANAAAQTGLLRLGFQPPNAVPPTPLARMDHGLGQPSTGEPAPVSPAELAASAEPAVPPAAEPLAAPPPAPRPATPAFVWPEQEETDEESTIVEETFIGDIVAAMNKDETSAPSTQDSDLDWLFQPAEALDASAKDPDQALRDLLPDEAAEGELAFAQPTPDASQEAAVDDLAFAGLEPAEIAALEAAATPTPGLMWRFPAETSRRATILTDRYLISANIDPRHLAEIESMLQMGQFPRRLLGHRARLIPLERITALTANPGAPTLQVSYLRNQDTRQQTFILASPAQRDEVFETFKSRHGAQFHATTQRANLLDTLAVPGLTLLVLALITGLLYFWAMDVVVPPSSLGVWLPNTWTAWLASDAAVNLPLYVVLAGGGLMLLVMLWLVLTLRKPRRALVLKRISEDNPPASPE